MKNVSHLHVTSIGEPVTAQQGFTMIELMTAVAILAILASLAVPSFQNIIRSNQIASQTNALVSSLAVARSEASKRGVRVSVCASINGAACSGAASWSAGWLVFSDNDGDGDLDAGVDTLLQVPPTPSSGMIIDGANTSITFQSSGGSNAAQTFTVSKAGCGAGQQRQLNVSTNGRTNLVKQDCP